MQRIETLTKAALSQAARVWSPNGGAGVAFILEGDTTTYHGLHTDDVSSLTLAEGGFVSEAEGIIHAVKTTMSTLPTRGKKITITMDGTAITRRIEQVITSQGDAGVQIVYGRTNK